MQTLSCGEGGNRTGSILKAGLHLELDCGLWAICPVSMETTYQLENQAHWKKVKSFSHVWLFATPWTVTHQAPPSMGFSRQKYWSGVPLPSPGDLPNPGIEPGSPALHADPLTSEHQGSPSLKEYPNYLCNRIESYILLCLLGYNHRPIDNCPLLPRLKAYESRVNFDCQGIWGGGFVHIHLGYITFSQKPVRVLG